MYFTIVIGGLLEVLGWWNLCAKTPFYVLILIRLRQDGPVACGVQWTERYSILISCRSAASVCSVSRHDFHRSYTAGADLSLLVYSSRSCLHHGFRILATWTYHSKVGASILSSLADLLHDHLLLRRSGLFGRSGCWRSESW